jgi:hypothetical protein
MDRAELNKLIASNSPRVTFKCNDTASSAAWNDFVFVHVDGSYASYIKCVNCDNLLKWKQRDGTSGLLNHTKSCSKKKGTVATRKLTDLGFNASKKDSANVPTSVKSEVADALVLMCATDIR